MLYAPFTLDRRNHQARRWLRSKEQRKVPGGKREQFPSTWALEHHLPPYLRELPFDPDAGRAAENANESHAA